MNTMAPIRRAELHAGRVHLTTGPAAARSQTPLKAADAARGECRSRYSPEPETPAWQACAQSVHLHARSRSRGSGFPVASHRGRAGLPATALALATGGLPFEDDLVPS